MSAAGISPFQQNQFRVFMSIDPAFFHCAGLEVTKFFSTIAETGQV
jgi:hypothetical protein